MTRTFFFFNDTATTEIYTLSLHDALPILAYVALQVEVDARMEWSSGHRQQRRRGARLADDVSQRAHLDRKSTRLNSSHGYISYAVFCLKKKNAQSNHRQRSAPTLQ